MTITVKQSPSVPLSANAVVIPFASDKKFIFPKMPTVAKNAVKKYIKKTDYKGKRGQMVFVQHFAGKCNWIVLAGIGDVKKLTVEQLSLLIQQAVRSVQKQKSANVVVSVDALSEAFEQEVIGRVIAESAHVGSYTFTNKRKQAKKVSSIAIHTSNKDEVKALKEGVRAGAIVGEATTMVRDYGNLPSNKMTPKVLTEMARKSAKETGQKVTVLGEKQMAKEKMGGTLGVTSGSTHEAQFIIMEHMKGKKGDSPVVLVGKGITFDSGGISIKPSAAMDEMKFDMSGGGTVIGTMHAIGKLKLSVNVVGLVPATENVPSGSSYKPGDVLTYADGTTVEVLNTDAEGRLVLGDALIYARKYKPKAILDLATLTGAIVVALGDSATAVFANDDALASEIDNASKTAGESVWRMPLPEDWMPRVHSKVADLQNISNKPGGGSITAAKFLQHFVKKGTAWAHFDIAGTAWVTGETPAFEHGATATMLKTLVEYIKNQ
mgnify:CR=1 FL=1